MTEKHKMVGWKAYFLINGEIVEYASDKTKWNDLPQEGCMWVNRYYHYYERVQNEYITQGLSGQDVFFQDNCMMRRVMENNPPIECKFGQMIPDELWGKIDKHCRADKEVIKEML